MQLDSSFSLLSCLHFFDFAAFEVLRVNQILVFYKILETVNPSRIGKSTVSTLGSS